MDVHVIRDPICVDGDLSRGAGDLPAAGLGARCACHASGGREHAQCCQPEHDHSSHIAPPNARLFTGQWGGYVWSGATAVTIVTNRQISLDLPHLGPATAPVREGFAWSL